MNEYSAISPSMKDQWSGKTLLRLRRTKFEEPSRWSTQSAVPATALPPRVVGGIGSPVRTGPS